MSRHKALTPYRRVHITMPVDLHERVLLTCGIKASSFNGRTYGRLSQVIATALIKFLETNPDLEKEFNGPVPTIDEL